MISSCSCTRFISTRQKKLGDGAAQQERARTSLPRCDPARWQSAQKYGTWTHEHVVSDRTMQSTGSLSGAWTAWLERLPDLRPSPAAPKSSTPALETILQKPLNGGILMCDELTRTESSKTPHSCVSDMRPAAHCNIPVRSLDIRTKHSSAQPTRPGCCERLRPCARPRSRAPCPRAQTRHRHAMRAGARAQHCKGG